METKGKGNHVPELTVPTTEEAGEEMATEAPLDDPSTITGASESNKAGCIRIRSNKQNNACSRRKIPPTMAEAIEKDMASS